MSHRSGRQIPADGVIHMIRAAFTVIALFLAGCQQAVTQRTTVEELIARPEAYSGKQLRVSGYWLRGYEWSLLKTQPRSKDGSIWCELEMDGVKARDLALEMHAAREQAGLHGPEVLTWIDCVGVFENRTLTDDDRAGSGQRGFGHLGTRPSQFRVQHIISYRVLELPPHDQ